MEKKICPNCDREYPMEKATCDDCSVELITPEQFNLDEWDIIFHHTLKANVDDIAADLRERSIDARVTYIDLSDYDLSIRSISKWALFVPLDSLENTIEVLHELHGQIHEIEEEDLEVMYAKYEFLRKPVEELAADPQLCKPLCDAIRDPDLPESLAEKARDALIGAGPASEEPVLEALLAEIHEDHYAMREYAIEIFIDVLLEHGSERAVERLATLLSDAESTLRLNAVYCIGQLGDYDQVSLLLPMLEDEDEDVRDEANDALSIITDEGVHFDIIDTVELGWEVREMWEKVLSDKRE